MNQSDMIYLQGEREYRIKALVADLQGNGFRGYVEVSRIDGHGKIDNNYLRYGKLIRATWMEALEDAEQLGNELAHQDCVDGLVHCFSTRSPSSTDAMLSILRSTAAPSARASA
ncbi:MAG: hypothetical protein M0Q54_12810 [Pigmentiphaga sp.]|nr:hypothetical protein [Pigmentiphaga sp.]